jgi:hypothetical protein
VSKMNNDDMQNSNKISLRAANPDNRREVEAIIKLFKQVYGDQYPFQAVYQPAYWTSRGGGRFRSLVAYSADELVGHLAMRPYSGNQKLMELCLFAYDGSQIGSVDEMMQEAKEVLHRQAKRQDWELVYCYSFSSLPILQRIATEGLGFKEVALCPAMARCQDGTRPAVIISQAKVNSKDAAIKTEKLYPPYWHKESIEGSFGSLGYAHEFLFSAAGNFGEAVSVDVKLEQVAIPGTEVYFVTPSEELNSIGMSDFIAKHSSNSSNQFVFLDVRSPLCPAVALQLERAGFRYSGILPLMRGSDSIVYARIPSTSLCLKTLESADAKALGHYYLNYELPQSIHTKVTSMANEVPDGLLTGEIVRDSVESMPVRRS